MPCCDSRVRADGELGNSAFFVGAKTAVVQTRGCLYVAKDSNQEECHHTYMKCNEFYFITIIIKLLLFWAFLTSLMFLHTD